MSDVDCLIRVDNFHPAFLHGIRIDKATRQAVLRWHRLPRLDLPVKLVELRGIDPLTPRLPAGLEVFISVVFRYNWLSLFGTQIGI